MINPKTHIEDIMTTDQELKEMRAETERLMQSTWRTLDKHAADLDRSSAEFDKRMAESRAEFDQRSADFDRRMAKLDEKLKEIGERIGGISDNQGFHAEQFFQDVFKRKLEFGMVKYYEMIPNLTYRDKGVNIEFDIALLNGNSIALIEVKNRIHPNFVRELAEERIEKFREYFPRYKDYSAYLGIAGFSFCDEVLDQASRYGIGIVKQVGDGVEIEASNLRAY